MNTFRLRILAADKPFYEGECLSLIVPTNDGERGIQAHHRNMISAIVPGVLWFRLTDGPAQRAAVSSGLMKVEDNEVLILVDAAERPEEIDVNRAKRAAAQAREALLQKRSLREYKTAQANLARAINRLRVRGVSGLGPFA